jgi:predicted  nucleic acid-binding Zn-ribbon protein
MSDTPRTNLEAFFPHESMYQVCDADFCRKLERELNAANERIKRLEDSVSYWNERYNDLNHKVQNRDNY